MDSNDSSTSCDEPNPKKRRLSSDAKLIKEQKDMIYKQTMTIGKLQAEIDSSKNAAKMLATLESETRLKSRNRELEKEIVDGQAEYQRSLAEIRSTVNNMTATFEKEAVAKDKRIHNLEQQLASVRNVKPDPGYSDEIKLLQDQIDKLQSTCNNYEKKISDYESQFQLKTKNEAALQSKIDEMKEQVEAQKKLLQNTIEERKKYMNEMEVQLESETNHGTSLRQKIDELKQQNDNQKELFQTKENEFQAAIQDRSNKINDLEAKVESRRKEATALQEQVSKLEAAQKDSIQANMRLKDLEIQKLNETREAAIKDIKSKLEMAKNEKKRAETEVAGLKNVVQNLDKKITDGQQSVFRLQNHNKELADKISVSKNNEAKLQTQLEEVQQKERGARAIIAEQEKKIQESKPENMLRVITLDEIRDGSACDRLRCNTIVNVTRLSYTSGSVNLFSTSEPFEKPCKLKPSIEKPYFQVQIDGELEVTSIKGLSETLPLIHSCNLAKLDLGSAEINYADFIKIVSSKTITNFYGGNVCKREGRKNVNVGINEILKELPNIEECELYTVSSDGCKKIAELPTFPNLRQLTLHLSGSLFNTVAFGGFIEKHPNTKFLFKYISMSLTEKKKIEAQQKQLRGSLPSDCNIVFEY